MSSLLPVQLPAPRPRADVSSSDRRPADGGSDHFADSLASARAGTPPADDGSDAAAAKARLAAEQRAIRAQLQAVMLYGAMRYAATKTDATAVPTSALPATPGDVAATEIPAGIIALTDPSLLPSLTGQPDANAIPGIIGGDWQQAAVPSFAVAAGIVPMPRDTEPNDDAALQDAPLDTAANTDVSQLPVAGVTAAAMAVLNALPMPQLAAPDEPVIDESIDGDAGTGGDARGQLVATQPDPDGDATQAARLEALQRLHAELSAAASSPVASALLEDHFDAPAVTVADVMPITNAVIGELGNLRVPQVDNDDDRRAAFEASRVTAGPATGAPKGTTAIVRDLTTLAPEFREKLEKVIERMRAEYGREVTVVETSRSQARQDALYAQGRTTPGPVVTWTRNSRHLKGLAADLLVDGKWDNPAGYADLATVAAEEGLRTLGSRDAGHVEMSGERGVSAETLGTLLSDLQGDAGDGARQASATLRQVTSAEEVARNTGMAQVASVAQVARVATVAQVARVAEVARPGAPRQRAAADSAVSPLAVSGVTSVNTGNDASLMAARVISAPTPVHMADRISQLMDLQATQAAKPLNSVLLRMDNANGIEDQIRIDTRGTSVDARLGLGNAQQAAALTDRIGELRDALERRGLSAEGVRVQAASGPRATDTATFSRPAAPVLEMAAMRAASDSQSQGNTRDQSGRDQQQREALAREQSRPSQRSSSDDSRNRSRREQQEARR